jgi:hypothetical protein
VELIGSNRSFAVGLIAKEHFVKPRQLLAHIFGAIIRRSNHFDLA